jgi:GH43 family beta-xylosidase
MADLESTYLNPVYPRSFPDPFVIKYCGTYYAYSTGHASDGRIFEVLTSTDLVNWHPQGGAMEPLTTGEPFYWAPEVTYYNGKFYLYYSVGNETFMTLRVAVSETPAHGFVDAGVELTTQQFAIDAHVFRDTDGSWWMFYATDFLEHSHIGTGTVVDRMIDMFTLAGDPRAVTRAKYDWQVYDPERKEKGGVRWHTVEGPYVLKRKGTYYEMFSGGNWQNISYGVSFAVSSDLTDPSEWQQYSDGDKTLPLIRTIPGKVLGPGHNSVIHGPNNRELYCVYHLWQNGQRVLAIDRMDFAGGNRIFVSGPSFTPQRAPYLPAEEGFAISGSRSIRTGSSFYCELSLVGAGAEVCLLSSDGEVAGRLQLGTEETPALIWSPKDDSRQDVPLPSDFDKRAIHEIAIDIDGSSATFRVNKYDAVIHTRVPIAIESISVDDPARVQSIEITGGFEDLFEVDDAELRGWERQGEVNWDGKEFSVYMKDGSRLSRPVPAGDFEFGVNTRLSSSARLSIHCGVTCIISESSIRLGSNALVETPNLTGMFRQFRFVRQSDTVTLWLDGVEFGEAVAEAGNELRIIVDQGSMHLDMVRWTAI